MIRKAEIDDAEALARCHHDAILSIDRKFYNNEQIDAWRSGTVPAKYFDAIKNNEIFVIDQTGGIAAFGWMKSSPPEIRAIYVAPAYQGQGFASKLLIHLELKLRELGATEIVLGASLNAQTFYEKHNYLSGAQGTIELSGVSAAYISMTKKLG